MKVNIIIPVYNASLYLRRCVESVLFGDYQDIEVILVEDCSDDKSWELCQKLSEQYTKVKCFRNDQNRGVSYTRNRGLEKAEGEYIVFVDADDWVSKNYIETLVNCADKNPLALPITGFHFIDYVNSYNHDYIWNEKSGNAMLTCGSLFDLVDAFMLQQLWNKIFNRKIIEDKHVRFDESQSMGEDFQFVLDYIDSAHITQYVMIQKCLYYYIRNNNHSLMSKFGLVENENEYARLKKILRICDREKIDAVSAYNHAVLQVKQNYIYQACRNKKSSRQEVIAFVEQIMGDGKASKYYRFQKELLLKEKITRLLKKFKQLPGRVRGKAGRMKRQAVISASVKRLHQKEFTIISQNCIGGVFYHDMGLRFDSPTINLYFTAVDFCKFAGNLEYYLSLIPEMHWDEKYPLGYLDDVTIHFMHYDNCTQALEAWEKRKKRIHQGKVIIISTDMEGFGDHEYTEWEKIKYPKVLFTSQPQYGKGSNIIYYPEYKSNGSVKDLIPARKFYRNDILIDTINNGWNRQK